MTKRPVTNVAASVHQRLLNKARRENRPFNELLQVYAMERFLYRLSVSRHAEKFVLKGALMLTAWNAPISRPTMDIDLLGRTANDVDALVKIMREICGESVEADGLAFDPTTVAGQRIAEEAVYEGVRLRFRGALGNARITMQLDVGFGDVVEPSPRTVDYPTLLAMPAPRLPGYSRESTVAEKFEAMIKLGELNSRMKDFFDIWLLSKHFDFDGATLARAIGRTLAARGTDVSHRPIALTPEFAELPGKPAQWRAFVLKTRLSNVPEEFAPVVGAVSDFLTPVAEALVAGRKFEGRWSAPGPWTAVSPPTPA